MGGDEMTESSSAPTSWKTPWWNKESKKPVERKITAGGPDEDEPASGKSKSSPYLWHFIVMASAFSVNHGCVTSVLALTAAEFDLHLATSSNAMLYIIYALSALLLAVPLTKIYGCKRVLASSAGLYCFYVCSFGIIAVFGHEIDLRIQYAICLTGSFIGGIGAGALWTAQGTYFGKVAKYHAEATGQNIEDVNGFFGGVFSTVYVGGEVLLKLFSTVVQDTWGGGAGKEFVFAFYSVACILAAIALCFIKDLPADVDESEKDEPFFKLATKKLKDIKIVASDPKIWLIGPLQVAFGFGGAWVVSYLNGTLAKKSLGPSNIGLLTAIPAGYAAAVGIPYAWMAKTVGKNFFMNMSAVAYLIVALCGLLIPDKLVEIGWPAFIGLQICLGNVRAVGESTNKAMYADFFPKTQTGAFAMNIVYSGVSSTAGFLAFTFGIKPEIAGIILASLCVLSFVTTPMAFVVYNRSKSQEAQEKLLAEYEEEVTIA